MNGIRKWLHNNELKMLERELANIDKLRKMAEDTRAGLFRSRFTLIVGNYINKGASTISFYAIPPVGKMVNVEININGGVIIREIGREA